jgi:hypothetical protein
MPAYTPLSPESSVTPPIEADSPDYDDSPSPRQTGETPSDAYVALLLQAVRDGRYRKIEALIETHGQSLWIETFHSTCGAPGCGCVERTTPLKALFRINTDPTTREYDTERLALIQRLIDEQILSVETLDDKFVMDNLQMFGWVGDLKKVELLLHNIPVDRFIAMRDEYEQTALHVVLSGSSSEAQMISVGERLIEMGVPTGAKRDDGYTVFALAVDSLCVPLVRMLRGTSDVDDLLTRSQYTPNPLTGKKEYVPNQINLLHRILPYHALLKSPEALEDMRQVLEILFEMGIDLNYVDSFGVPAYRYVIAYQWIPYLPFSEEEFWNRIGLEQKYQEHPLREGYQDEMDLEDVFQYSEPGLDARIAVLFESLHATRYQKSPQTIAQTVVRLKRELETYPPQYLARNSSNFSNATHRLFGYKCLPEIEKFFEDLDFVPLQASV